MRNQKTASPAAAQEVEQLMLEELPQRASKASDRLMEQLAGTVLVHCEDLESSFLFRGAAEQPAVEKVAAGETPEYDCRLALRSKDIQEIAQGQLNPQIAMLSHKVHVEGNAALAVYFFNLLGRNDWN